MSITAVANQKGGVGKTALAVNLATALAQAGVSTLIIDLDPQNHVAEQLSVDVSDGRWLTEVFRGTRTLDECLYEVMPGLSIVPAGDDGVLIGVEQGLITETARESWLRRELGDIVDRFDEVLLDCPPNVGQLTVNALVACDRIITPVKMKDRGAASGAAQLMATIAMLRSRDFSPPDPVLVRNLVDDRELAVRAMEEALPGLGLRITRTRIMDRAAVTNAGMEGVPVLIRQPREPISEDLRSLASELFGIEAVPVETPA